jgi:hypothetical protein
MQMQDTLIFTFAFLIGGCAVFAAFIAALLTIGGEK